ncbi:MAG TPA: peptidoglycan synthetase, partial [Bacteroidales bacterium]|nr:peptidoglycan synthetase [Bacteroidales bacterium]
LAQNSTTSVYLDFAHSPSKVKATIEAVKQQNPNRRLVICFELHTYSSLTKEFLNQYNGTLVGADTAYVFYDPQAVEMKKLPYLEPTDVLKSFGSPTPNIFINSNELIETLLKQSWNNTNLIVMTSGNFAGVDLQHLADKIVV